jgi:TorA maturation chaperone TorD
MSQSDTINPVLDNRAYVYLLFQNVFGTEPMREQLEIVSSDITQQTLKAFDENATKGYGPALQKAIKAMGAYHECSDEAIDSLRSMYTRLFLGPGELDAPPWESIYVSKRQLLFQESTLHVRNTYRSQGFLPADYPRVADDHIALECAFMAQLGSRASDACREGDLPRYGVALEASGQFLKDHLLVWVPDYAADMAKSPGSGFYQAMTELALEFMKVDEYIVHELSAT